MAQKRIAFVISTQHIIPHGGIGQFLKGFYEQICAPNDIVMDVVTDQMPTNGFLESFKFGGSVYYPSKAEMAKYTKHNALFSFDDSVNFEKSINFRDAMFMASKENIYDAIVINSIDAVSGIYCLGLHRYIPVVMYTHLAMMLGDSNIKDTAFSQEFFDYFVTNSMLPGLVIGTQTKTNKRLIEKSFGRTDPIVLPMPIPETDLLELDSTNREGVLFIGRYESGKNPQLFVSSVIAAGLKAKIITNANGAKKFVSLFERENYTNYEIKIGVIGKDKVDFIKSAKVYFNPSLLESFGFTMLEGLSQLPTLVLAGKQWHQSFEELGFSFFKTDTQGAAEELKMLHAGDFSDVVFKNNTIAREYNKDAVTSWLEFIGNITEVTPSMCRFTSVDNFYWAEFLSSLDRTVSIEDIQNGYRNRGKFNRTQLPSGTWCSETNEPPRKDASGLEDFI